MQQFIPLITFKLILGKACEKEMLTGDFNYSYNAYFIKKKKPLKII